MMLREPTEQFAHHNKNIPKDHAIVNKMHVYLIPNR